MSRVQTPPRKSAAPPSGRMAAIRAAATGGAIAPPQPQPRQRATAATPSPAPSAKPKRSPDAQRVYSETIMAESRRRLETAATIAAHPLYRNREAMAQRLVAAGLNADQIGEALRISRATAPVTAAEVAEDRQAATQRLWDRAIAAVAS